MTSRCVSGQEIMELDQSGFDTQSPTLYAGNIGDDKYIIQITKLDIRLMEGSKCVAYASWRKVSI